VIRESIIEYVSKSKIPEMLANFKNEIVNKQRIEVVKSAKSFLQNISSREMLATAQSGEIDVSIADFMLRLILGIKHFDDTLFGFFQCGDLDLIKHGDK
jgi:hypothetical protein